MPEIDHLLVRDRRDALDLSNEDVARLIDKEKPYVENILTAAGRQVSKRVIYRLSRALDLPVDKILIDAGEPDPQRGAKAPSKVTGTAA